MNPQQIIKRPLLTEKGNVLRETGGAVRLRPTPSSCRARSLFEVATSANSTRFATRSRSCSRSTSSTCTPHRARQGESGSAVAMAAGPTEESVVTLARGQTIEFFEGVSPMAIKRNKPTSAGRRGMSSQDFGEITHGNSRTSAARHRPETGGRNCRPHHVALPRRRSQAALPYHRFQARQDRRASQGRDDRVRPEPLGAHRAAALRGRREALHPRPREDERGRHGHRGELGRHQAGQLPAAAVHPARHRDPQHRAADRQGRPARPRRRYRGAAHGQGRRLGHPASAPGRDAKVHPHCRATIVHVATPTHHFELGRPSVSAGSAAPAHAAAHQNPIDTRWVVAKPFVVCRHPCSPWVRLPRATRAPQQRTDSSSSVPARASSLIRLVSSIMVLLRLHLIPSSSPEDKRRP